MKIPKKPRIGIVGAGAVGIEMVRLLRAHEFPMESLTLFARTARTEWVDGAPFDVRVASLSEVFDDLDLAFFAGTEGEKGASREFGWAAVERGCVVIDNGDDFRMDPRVPLVVPEINPEALQNHQGFIANPNCSTIIALMALAPLHRVAKLKRVVASTYQAVSGSGEFAMTVLERQARACVTGASIDAEVYPHQIAFNVIPMIGSASARYDESSEEVKMRRETHKILGNDSIGVVATCVRVPVYNGHSIAMTVEFENTMTAHVAHELLRFAPGVKVVDDPAANLYPMPIEVDETPHVLVGRIRNDPTVPNGISLFVAGDNLWKGAALNAIQIAEALMR